MENQEIVVEKNNSNRHNYVETYVYYSAIRALMERDGFNFMEAQSHPATLAFSLIEGAFHTYNPKMSEEKIYEIFSEA